MEHQTHSILFKGQQLHFIDTMNRSQGQTAPGTVVLIHGFPERGSIFSRQIKALGNRYRLIIPDLPGSGSSAYNARLSSTTDFAIGIKAILESLAIDEAVLIGHSMGGYIALAFADKYPAATLGLGLLHSTAYADSEQKKANRLKAIQTMEQYGGPAFLKSMIPALFGRRFKAEQGEFIEALTQAGQNFETSALQQYYQIMHDRADRTSVFKSLSIPYLFLSGTEDQAAPAGDLIAQSAIPDVAMIDVLEGAGHMGFIEQPEAVNALLIEFLSLIDTVLSKDAR